MLRINLNPKDFPEEEGDKKFWEMQLPIYEGIMNQAYDLLKEMEKKRYLTRPQVRAVIDISVKQTIKGLQNDKLLDILTEELMKFHLRSKKETFNV